MRPCGEVVNAVGCAGEWSEAGGGPKVISCHGDAVVAQITRRFQVQAGYLAAQRLPRRNPESAVLPLHHPATATAIVSEGGEARQTDGGGGRARASALGAGQREGG